MFGAGALLCLSVTLALPPVQCPRLAAQSPGGCAGAACSGARIPSCPVWTITDMSIAGAFGYGFQVLRTPWLMASRSSRWIALTLIALSAFGVTWLWQILPPNASSWIGYAAMFGVANAFCWLLLVPNQLLLARAAFQLRMPGVRRDVALSGLLYVCIGMAVPIALFPAHALGAGLMLVLSAAGAALMLLLPVSVVLAAWIALSALSVTDGGVWWDVCSHCIPWGGAASCSRWQ